MSLTLVLLKKFWAEIRQAILEKRSLPEDSFYDSEGNLTVDPKKLMPLKFLEITKVMLCVMLLKY